MTDSHGTIVCIYLPTIISDSIKNPTIHVYINIVNPMDPMGK